ncbi:MAG: ATP-dependent 6-phosphofructokinase [Verrucomicrobiaceae bacterium]|nr:MAG: ATP-dependent 6-phosphofructokinase [Verrucomicrobiaceae bacterium]
MPVELDPASLNIRSLGERAISSPLEKLMAECTPGHAFYSDDHRVLVKHELPDVSRMIADGEEFPCFEVAGPRKKIYFDPSQTTCAIVTCGGLCPGFNDVIRAIVMQAYYRYGVRRIYGIPYGFEGLIPEYGHAIVNLTPEAVANIHEFGGTWLGTSRGPQDVLRMVDRLQELGVNVLFVIGGDGSQRGALAIEQEARKRGAKLAVVGVPKTIDNDMIYMDKSFGYETAAAAAVNAVHAAHTEARSARGGIGLVKLMGRHSGFIACAAAIASGEVNAVLIPEVPFALDGEHGFLEVIRQRVVSRGHAVVIVAEGAGQELLGQTGETDASGNLRLGDIGHFLKDRLADHFSKCKTALTLKYIDPSYMIRSVPASPQDRIYCMRLGQAAVHAGMAGKTGLIVARWHSVYVHVPIAVATSARRTVDPGKDIWLSVLESTGQPARYY